MPGNRRTSVIEITPSRRFYVRVRGSRWRIQHAHVGFGVMLAGVVLVWRDRRDWPWSLWDY